MCKETMVEKKVTYILEMEGNFIVIEHVPARECLETGERLQEIAWEQRKPSRIIETPVFEFAA